MAAPSGGDTDIYAGAMWTIGCACPLCFRVLLGWLVLRLYSPVWWLPVALLTNYFAVQSPHLLLRLEESAVVPYHVARDERNPYRHISTIG